MTGEWEGLAALATTASAVIIAVQAWYTRRSVAKTEETLVLARAEADQGKVALADVQKARIDSEMPRLSIALTQPRGATVLTGSSLSLENYETSAPGQVQFTMPRDRDIKIAIRAGVVVSNDGPRRAPLVYSTPRSGRGNGGVPTVIEVGGSVTIWADRIETLEEWIRIAKMYLPDPTPYDEGMNALIFSMAYMFPGDTGASESHEVITGGSIVQPIPGDDGGWTIAAYADGRYGQATCSVQPFTRKYWASRIANRELV